MISTYQAKYYAHELTRCHAVAATIAQVLEASQRLFNKKRNKLECWADDKLLAAEEALKDTKARIAQLKRDALIGSFQQRLQEKTDTQMLFTLRWQRV